MHRGYQPHIPTSTPQKQLFCLLDTPHDDYTGITAALETEKLLQQAANTSMHFGLYMR